jgi:hypothetical protein
MTGVDRVVRVTPCARSPSWPIAARIAEELAPRHELLGELVAGGSLLPERDARGFPTTGRITTLIESPGSRPISACAAALPGRDRAMLLRVRGR